MDIKQRSTEKENLKNNTFNLENTKKVLWWKRALYKHAHALII